MRPHPALLFLLVIWVALPLVLEDYSLYRVSQAGVYALAIVGLNLLVGVSGQLSVGHSAFFAIGAYTVAVISGDGGGSVYPALLLGGLLCLVLGTVFGRAVTGLSNVNLMLATWGLALALPQLLKSSWLEAWTGGASGVYLEKPGPPFGLPLSHDQWWHYVTLAALLVFLPMAAAIKRGRGGRALVALRDHPQAALSLGVNVPLYKSLAFGISAFYAGLAGGLAGLLADFVAPDTYDIFFALILLVGAVVSGLGGIWTALFGGLLVEFLPDAAALVTNDRLFPGITYGLLMIVMIYLLPNGLSGLLARLSDRFPPGIFRGRK